MSHKRAWTDADIASLKHLAGKMAATQIAAELGRTYTGADHQGFQAEASAAPELQGRLIDHLLGPYNCIIIVGAYEAAMSAHFAGVIDGHNAIILHYGIRSAATSRQAQYNRSTTPPRWSRTAMSGKYEP